MKKLYSAKITSNAQIAQDIFAMELAVKEGYEPSKAGQFVNIYLNDGVHLLPRPISISRRQKDSLTLVYKVVGEGSKIMSMLNAGDDVSVSSPLGNGFTFPESGKVLLVGGGLGVAPMLETAFCAKALGLDVTVALGYRDVCFLKDSFVQAADRLLLATEDGSIGFKGNVVQLLTAENIEKDTKVLSCGPKPMLKALASLCKEKELSLQVSLEERMGCGYGACVGCICKLDINGQTVQKRVCKDGPVFDGSEVVF